MNKIQKKQKFIKLPSNTTLQDGVETNVALEETEWVTSIEGKAVQVSTAKFSPINREVVAAQLSNQIKELQAMLDDLNAIK